MNVPRLHTQQGWFGIIFVLLLVGVGVTFFAVSRTSVSPRTQREAITVAALAKAKDALLNYSIARAPSLDGRPGEFPCPSKTAPKETPSPGEPVYGEGRNTCVNDNLIGRLPWRTLGIEEPLDGDGEPLWYALSTNFNPTVGAVSLSAAINSDTLGSLSIYANNGATQVTNEAVAVVLAAGAAYPNQDRSAVLRACTASGKTERADRCADNYLESIGVAKNRQFAGPFAQAAPSTSFNDKLVYLKTEEFIPQIEERIAKDLEKGLRAYFAKNMYFPYAAYYSDLSTKDRGLNANCAAGIFSGRIPQNIGGIGDPVSPRTICTGLDDWNTGGVSFMLPQWFLKNNWNTNIYYAVAKQFAKGGTRSCINAGDCLTVGTDTNVAALFILPGIPAKGQARPSYTGASPASWNMAPGYDLKNYFEDSKNQQGWSTPGGMPYVQPTSTGASRDKMVIIKP
jgi:hypothetical protein